MFGDGMPLGRVGVMGILSLDCISEQLIFFGSPRTALSGRCKRHVDVVVRGNLK
jgi:hypothetical protein